MSTADAVYKQLQADFPKADARWVLNSDVRWEPVAAYPLSKIDFANSRKWNASQHEAKLKRFVQKISRGDKKPVILAKVPDNPKFVVLDGHHRVLAYQRLGTPVRAYCCYITGKSVEPAMEMHANQRSGNSGPPTKSSPVKLSNETYAPSELNTKQLRAILYI